jgi:hypothetical protein
VRLTMLYVDHAHDPTARQKPVRGVRQPIR